MKIPASLYQLDAECLHGSVLLDTVAVRNDYGGWNSVASCRKANGLAVIATRGGDYAGGLSGTTQVVEVDEPSPHLERTRRRVILVLHPDFSSHS